LSPRIALLTFGSLGDVQPYLALAEALRERGAEPLLGALVHHGGAGTTGAAFHAGVPQVVMPSFFDQFFWAERVRATGVGPAPLPVARLRPDRLAVALSRALEPGVRARSSALAERLRSEEGASAAAEILLRHLGR
jgi:sterol 3beta-glucosyltransferase